MNQLLYNQNNICLFEILWLTLYKINNLNKDNMKFICEHCGEIINCASIIVDNHFLHINCVVGFKKEIKEVIKPQYIKQKNKFFKCKIINKCHKNDL